MENKAIGRLQKALRAVRRMYHSVNNLRMKIKDADFKEFGVLEYKKVLPEEIKDPKRLQYMRRLELAKNGYVDKSLKVLSVAAKQKQRFIDHDHKTVLVGNIRAIEGENLVAMVQLGFDPIDGTFRTAYRNHENIPLWKPYDQVKLKQHFAALHPATHKKLRMEHIFCGSDNFNVDQEQKKAVHLFYNDAVYKTFQSNTYFKNEVLSPKEDLLLHPENYLGKQFYLSMSKANETIMTLTETTDCYFVFQSFMETAPKPESIYFDRQEFKERFLDSGITMLAYLKHGLRLGVQNGTLHIGKLDGVHGKSHLKWENFENRINSSSLSAIEKYYLSKEVISKKNFFVETDAISLKSDTKEASLKKHYGTGQWHFAEGGKNLAALNYRPVDDLVLQHINDRYSESKNFRLVVAQLDKNNGIETMQMKPS